MVSRRRLVLIAGSALALTAAATPVAQAHEGPGAGTAPGLTVQARWTTDDAGALRIVATVRNRGTATAQQPLLRVGAAGIPAASWSPACLAVTALKHEPSAPALAARSTDCRLAALPAGATRRVAVVPTPGSGSTIAVGVRDGADGIEGRRGLVRLADPVGATARIVPGQRAAGGVTLVVRARRAGAAQLVVEVPVGWARADVVALRGVVRFSAPGTQTVVLRAFPAGEAALRAAPAFPVGLARVTTTFVPDDGLPAAPSEDRAAIAPR